MNIDSAIFVAGAATLPGYAVYSELKRLGYRRIITNDDIGLDMNDCTAVNRFFREEHPEYVFVAGSSSGGIGLNRKKPADLMLENLVTATNILSAAHENRTTKLLYLASSCVYPRDCPQPMRVDYLFSGPLEPTSEAYGLAKLAGLTLCRAYRRQYGDNFIVAIPATPFGPDDRSDPDDAHVIDSMIAKMLRAKNEGHEEVVLWGTGAPRRDFIYQDDLGRACVWIMDHYDGELPVNVTGTGPITVAELAEKIRSLVGFNGRVRFDPSYPDGAPVKCLDGSLLRDMGWRPIWNFDEALSVTCKSAQRRLAGDDCGCN